MLLNCRLGRMAIIFAGAFILLTIASGCGNLLIHLKPVTAQKLKKTSQKEIIRIPLPKDARNLKKPSNFIGHIRNGYGVPLADITASQDVNIWVQDSLVKSFEKAGFKVAKEDRSTEDICVFTSIRALKCEAMMQYNATVIFDVKLKKNKLTFFEKAFSGVYTQTNWRSSAAGYQETLTKAMEQCIERMMPVLIKEIENSSKTIASMNGVDKKTPEHIPEIQKTIKKKVKKTGYSKKSLDDIYF